MNNINGTGNVRRHLVSEGDYDGRPYRSYSDGKLKAATSRGWLQFEDLSALKKYHDNCGEEQQIEEPRISFMDRFANRLRGIAFD